MKDFYIQLKKIIDHSIKDINYLYLANFLTFHNIFNLLINYLIN